MDFARGRALRPPATDIAVAAAFAVLGQLVTWKVLQEPQTYMGSRGVNALLNLLFMGALAWRRRAPLAAVTWAVVVYFLPHAVIPLDSPFLTGAVPLIVLTASAGYYCRSRRNAVIALAVSFVGLLVITLTVPWLRTPESFLINTVFLVVPWLGARGLREREKRAARLASSLAVERATKEAAMSAAAAEERARITRELHDIVAHSVSMMVIQIGAARMQIQAGSAAATAPLLQAEKVGRQALDDLRRLLGVLRADEATDAARDTDPQPGVSELDSLIDQARATGLQVELEVLGEPVELPAALDLTAYRIVQESLTNTLKHSGAREATVRLGYTASSLIIEVIDDGTGNSSDDVAGHGLVGMAERAFLFRGTFQAGHQEDGGWRVHVEFPLAIRTVENAPPLFPIR